MRPRCTQLAQINLQILAHLLVVHAKHVTQVDVVESLATIREKQKTSDLVSGGA